MSVTVLAGKPEGLLLKIKQGIESGDIDAFLDVNGRFTHVADQLQNKAFLIPSIGEGTLVFKIQFAVMPKDDDYRKFLAGAYHGHCIQMLITHFRNDFTVAVAQ